MAAAILTQVPFTSPILMPMRYLMDAAGPWDVLLAAALLSVATMLAIFVGGRIYRTGILMAGKRPNIREVWRWLRHPSR